MSRRKSKTDRELIADLTDSTQHFCNSVYDEKTRGCKDCPLAQYETSDCRLAYMQYILEKKNKEGKIDE